MPSKASPPDAFLRELAATPRATGSDALQQARERCAAELASCGFEVRRQRFDFSALPGRYGTPLIGLVAAATLVAACQAGARGERWTPALVLVIAATLLAGIGRWTTRHGVLELPMLRTSGVNLEASRPGDSPRVWLCAHLDTKSQPIPTLVRTAGVALLASGAAIAAVLALAAALDRHPAGGLWITATVVTLLGALPVVLSVVSSRSPGALDNASGVVTVVEVARQMEGVAGIGVLLTDAEELGLAGARAWARSHPHATVLNCDGVDDSGAINVLHTGRAPERVLRAAAMAARGHDVIVRARRMPLGILMDSVAFSDAGMDAVTFSRGSYRSLARVHSARDNLRAMDGRGIAGTASVMAATARILLGQHQDSDPHDGATI